MFLIILMLGQILSLSNILQGPPVAGITFRTLPVKTKIRLELVTTGDNSYRVAFWAEGKSPEEVAASVAKELTRGGELPRHFHAEKCTPFRRGHRCVS
jgi:hypothetical protein